MAEEEGGEAAPAKKSKKGLFLIIGVVVLVVVIGAGAFLLLGKKSGGGEGGGGHEGGGGGHEAPAEGGHGGKAGGKEDKIPLVALDSFVLNLAEQGRFLKITMQFELTEAAHQALVTDRMPQLRDAIITLMSSKSVEAVSSPEAKLQLKDELLLRANQSMGKDVFKNLYFTEFVMQ